MTNSEPEQQAASDGVPVDAASFSALMSSFAPFETAPRLMVAVSGGVDSMALTLLAAQWCAERNGKVLAVTVDHGLRPAAAAEAQWVRLQLAQYGIDHRVLHWTGPKPGAAIQQEARAARYRLIDELAAQLGILHVLVGHHLNDQAETIIMRQNHASGPVGLAGMSGQRYLRHCRLLRPLLAVPRKNLVATLRGFAPPNSGQVADGQKWLEDPSNRNLAFERVRIRQELRERQNLSSGAISLHDFGALARARQHIENAVGAFLARHVYLAPDGVAAVNWPGFMDDQSDPKRPERGSISGLSDFDIAAYGIGHVLRCVGGASYAPARDSVRQILQLIRQSEPARHSLAGCVLHRRKNHILIYREAGRMDKTPQPVWPGQKNRWDHRFELQLEGGVKPATGGDFAGFSIAPLGMCDPFHKRAFRRAMAQFVPFWASRPHQALAVLPVLLWQDQPLSVAGLEICALSDVLSAAGCPTAQLELFLAIRVTWRFAPSTPLWEGGFKFVANP